MLDAGQEGIVIATSSGAGAEGTTYRTPAYASTKNAVVTIMECLHGQLRDRNASIRAAVAFPPMAATNLAGRGEAMKYIEQQLNSQGVPAVLVQPEPVAEMILDGARTGRFFIRMGPDENRRFFGDVHPDEFFTWNSAMVNGRAEAQLANAAPDSYLW